MNHWSNQLHFMYGMWVERRLNDTNTWVTFNNMFMTSYDMLMSFCKGEIFALTQYLEDELDSYLTCW